MQCPSGGLELQRPGVGSTVLRIASTRFPSALNLEQMSCSELLPINYVLSHMLRSRSWLLNSPHLQDNGFLLIFQIYFKVLLFIRRGNTKLASAYLYVTRDSRPQVIGIKHRFPWGEQVQYLALGQKKKKRKEVLTTNLNRWIKGFCKILKSLPPWRGWQWGQIVETFPVELKTMLEPGAGQCNHQDAEVTGK